ncbi:MAG: molybdate ABC transporter substrate-binding protein [Devosiaceae bacterium]|nr:molybdate ABC transporter substrate-binding protein [Devosiaceae bacterium]
MKIWLKLQILLNLSFFVLVSGTVPALACARTEQLNIFVAASLVDVMEEIGVEFGAQTNCVDVKIIPGASSVLSRQINSGAPADIFISADRFNADLVADEFGLDSEIMFGNRLVIIAPENFESSFEIEQLAKNLNAENSGVGRLAIGDPAHVPAGIYAKQALQAAGIWDLVNDRLAPAGDVRAAVAFVVNRAAPFGIVYLSDAGFKGIKIVSEINDALHEPIIYWGLVMNEKSSNAAAFFNFIGSEFAQNVLVEAGFAPIISD